MNKSVVTSATGATPATPVEQMVSRVQATLVVSRKIEITSLQWKLDVRSPFWRLYFHLKNGAFVSVGGNRIELQPRRLYLIPAWVRFSAGTERDLVQHYVHFYLTGTPPTLARQVFDRPMALRSDDPAVTALVEQWLRTISDGEAPRFTELLWAHALIQAAIASAIDSLPAGKRDVLENWIRTSNPMGPALQRIERELAKPPTNSELARTCNQSTDHFARRFKAAVGLTPARYGAERRIAIAAQWLLASDRRIDDIALAAGFADRFHFSRVFRSMIGVPPAEFRTAHADAETSPTSERHS